MVWPFDREITGKPVNNPYDVLHAKVTSGLGVSGLSQAAGAHRDRIQTKFAEAEQALHDALARAGAVWVGDASDSAHAGIRPMAGFSADAAAASDSMAAAVQNEAEQFNRARNSMPEPVTVTASDSALEVGAAHLFGNQTDKEQQEAAQAAAEAEGFRIYDEYGAQSSDNRASIGAYPAPPRTALGAPDPGAQQAQVSGAGDPAGTVGQSAGGTTGGAPTSQPGSVGGAAQGGATAGGATAGSGAAGAGGSGTASPPAAAQAPGAGSTPGRPAGPDTGGGAAARPSTPVAGSTPGGVPRGAGTGSVIPAPVAFGGGAGGGAGGSRWRRTTGPGMFDNNPRGTRGGARAAASGSLPRGADVESRAAGRAAGPTPADGARTGPPNTGARGAAGTPGGAMAGGGGARREEDKEHETPDYLIETVDVYGDERKVAPPVIGEDPPPTNQ